TAVSTKGASRDGGAARGPLSRILKALSLTFAPHRRTGGQRRSCHVIERRFFPPSPEAACKVAQAIREHGYHWARIVERENGAFLQPGKGAQPLAGCKVSVAPIAESRR